MCSSDVTANFTRARGSRQAVSAHDGLPDGCARRAAHPTAPVRLSVVRKYALCTHVNDRSRSSIPRFRTSVYVLGSLFGVAAGVYHLNLYEGLTSATIELRERFGFMRPTGTEYQLTIS